MSIRVGLLGFGRTGSVVAKELVNDPSLSLEWVCRRHTQPGLTYGSHALGFNDNFAPFVTQKEFDKKIFVKSPVDIIIDFSSKSGRKLY
ncbi:MAG: hypothetical protein ACK41T_10995 [Pseudobdellovibrio sp.]